MNYLTNHEDQTTWTAKDRQDRINQLTEELKAKGKMKKPDVYRFALNNLGVSLRIIDSYLSELKLRGIIDIISDWSIIPWAPDAEIVIWKGEGS